MEFNSLAVNILIFLIAILLKSIFTVWNRSPEIEKNFV